MALTLVPRSARALSQQLNAFYRTLKGIDAESVYLRLPPSGSFEVRHSVTAVPILTVTDAGFAAVLGSEDIAANAITSAHIAPLTITGGDIAAGTITSDKLAGGIAVPANSITTNEIANGTIQSLDLGAGLTGRAYAVGISGTSIGVSSPVTIPGASLASVTSSGRLLVGCTLIGYGSTAALAGSTVGWYEGGSQRAALMNETMDASKYVVKTAWALFTPVDQTARTYTLVWNNPAGTLSINGGTMWAIELK